MSMRKVFLGVVSVVAMVFLVGVSAEDTKTKKEAPKTEALKTETTKSVAPCCNATSGEKTCCGQECTSAMDIGKKDCCRIEQIIAEKKAEIKKK